MNLLQKNLLKTVGKSRSKEEAMLKAKYAPSTARKQMSRTFKAKSIQDEIKKRDKKALKRYDEAFDADKVIALPDEPNVVMPDHQIRLRAVDMQFKARGVYQEGVIIDTLNQQNNYINLTDEQLKQVIESKRRKLGILESDGGDGTKDSGESAEVLQSSQETT